MIDYPWFLREALACVALYHEDNCDCMACLAAGGDDDALLALYHELRKRAGLVGSAAEPQAREDNGNGALTGSAGLVTEADESPVSETVGSESPSAAAHHCAFRLSHTSVHGDEEADVYLCDHPGCAHWVYGADRPTGSLAQPEAVSTAAPSASVKAGADSSSASGYASEEGPS